MHEEYLLTDSKCCSYNFGEQYTKYGQWPCGVSGKSNLAGRRSLKSNVNCGN